MTDRNFGAEIGTESERLKQWFTRAVGAYKIIFGLMIITALILVIIGVILNRTAAVLNFSLAALFVVIWGFITFHPAGLLAMFGLGSLNGLPKDWSVNRLIREGVLPDLSLSNMAKEGFALIGKWAHYSSHVAYFCIVVFTVLGTWYVRNPVAVLPVLVLLAGIGYWAVLSKAAAKWYYRITLGLLITSLGVFLYRGFFAEEGGGSWQAINAPKALHNLSSDLPSTGKNFKKSYWMEIKEDLAAVRFCKLDAGTWTFSMPDVESYDRLIAQERSPQKQRQLLEENPYRRLVQVGDTQPAHFALADGILVNETVVGEPIQVMKKNDCVIIQPRFNEHGQVPIRLVDNKGAMAVRIVFQKVGD